VRTIHRIATTVLAAAVALPFAAAPSAAATAEPAVDQANWFWREQVGGTVDPVGVPYPGQLPDHTVPKGRLAVAVDPRQASDPKQDPNKETYLSWGLFDVPLESSVSSFKVTLTVDKEAKGNVFAEPPKLIACRPKQAWSGGDGAEQFAGKPKDDCEGAAPGSFNEKKQTYTFDLTSLAQEWVDGESNNGVAIRHALDYAKPFQVIFLPAEKVTAKMTYTPAVGSNLPPSTPGGSGAVPPAAPVDTGAGTGGGSGVVPGIDPGNLAGNDVPTGQDPSLTPPVTASGQTTPVAAQPIVTDTKPTPAFWLAVAVGVVLLGLASLSLGDAAVPAATTRAPGGLSRALQKRRRTAGAAARVMAPPAAASTAPGVPTPVVTGRGVT
jgi:hypothetical protein